MDKFLGCFKGGAKSSYLADEKGASMMGCSVCISYARADKSFVKNLYDELSRDDRDIWVDWEDKPPGHSWQEWRQDCHVNIEQRDCFVFVLSPNSINDKMTNWEIDHAQKNGKRIIPVMCGKVEYNSVRKELLNKSWIFFETEESFKTGLKILLKNIDKDPQHVKIHTKILRRAIDWERHDFEKSLLLTGEDLIKAKNWLQASALGREPKPTTLHLSFITASDSLSVSMKKRKMIAVFFAFIVAIGIIWPSWGVFFFSLVFSHFFVYFSSN